MLRSAVAVTALLIAGAFVPGRASAQQPVDWDKIEIFMVTLLA